MGSDLVSNRIEKSSIGKCSCGGDKSLYKLPKKLDIDIIPYLEGFGSPAFDFKTTHLLKIESPEYIITGIKRLKEIRFVLKNKENKGYQEEFEKILIEYIGKGT